MLNTQDGQLRVDIQNESNTMKVMTFNIKGCRFTDSGFYTNMWNRIVDELITKTDASGRRYIDINLVGFQEVDAFCGIRDEDAFKGITQNPTEDYYLIKSLERYFVKDKDFFVYQRKIKGHPNGDFNSYSQMIFSRYPISLLNPDSQWPLSAKINIPGTTKPVYFHVMHPRVNSASCASNKAYLDRAEGNSEGSKNIIYAGDFNARYYSGACNSPRVNENYTFSIPTDPKNPNAKLDIIDYVMAHKESDWEVESSIMDRTWDVKVGDTERYWSDHNPVIATLKYRGISPTPASSIVASIIPEVVTPTLQVAAPLPGMEILKEGFKFTVASYNADAYCTNDGKQTVENKGEPDEYMRGCPAGDRVGWKEAMQTFVKSGKKWDIVGLQEMRPIHLSDSDILYFKKFMKDEHGIDYDCRTHPSLTSGNINAFCSIYPIVDGSIMTIKQERSYVDCAKVKTPAGEIIFCNAHPYYQAAVALFNEMETWILNDVVNAYIPPNLDSKLKEVYRRTLLARIILVGDMNAVQSQIAGKFQTTCKSPGDASGIDHVMTLDLQRQDISGVAPFNSPFLIPAENGCKTMIEKWPTDHGGPVVAEFTTKGIYLNQNGELVPPPTPTPQASQVINPSVTPEGSVDIINADLDKSGEVDITDFASFVEYYKAGNTKIDYDKDGETERDIDDFTYFVRYYKAKTD